MTTHREAERLEGDGYAIAVYAVLCKHANKNGLCWPSVERICKAVGWSKKVVQPAIQRLVDGGFIVRERRQLHGMDQSNRYKISAYVRVVPTVTAVVPSAPLGGSHGDSGCIPGNHELNVLELKPIELDTGDTPLPPVDPGPDFDKTFWSSYPKGRSSKQDARKFWDRLSIADRQAAVDALPAFLAGRDWKQGFHQAAEVWIRRRRWEDPPEPWSEAASTNGARPTAKDRRGMSNEEILAYVNGANDEQGRDGQDVVDVAGRVVQRGSDAGEDRGLSLVTR